MMGMKLTLSWLLLVMVVVQASAYAQNTESPNSAESAESSGGGAEPSLTPPLEPKDDLGFFETPEDYFDYIHARSQQGVKNDDNDEEYQSKPYNYDDSQEDEPAGSRKKRHLEEISRTLKGNSDITYAPMPSAYIRQRGYTSGGSSSYHDDSHDSLPETFSTISQTHRESEEYTPPEQTRRQISRTYVSSPQITHKTTRKVIRLRTNTAGAARIIALIRRLAGIRGVSGGSFSVTTGTGSASNSNAGVDRGILDRFIAAISRSLGNSRDTSSMSESQKYLYLQNSLHKLGGREGLSEVLRSIYGSEVNANTDLGELLTPIIRAITVIKTTKGDNWSNFVQNNESNQSGDNAHGPIIHDDAFTVIRRKVEVENDRQKNLIRKLWGLKKRLRECQNQ